MTGDEKRPLVTLGYLRDRKCRLHAWCRCCFAHDAPVDVLTLIARFGAATPLKSLEAKLRCSRCGRRRAYLDYVIPRGERLLE